ncbi:MAG: hypothetical protein OEY14_08600 [Myxococcales bacterium]|nr:hypothetical protein [Myxococcales bacterium]
MSHSEHQVALSTLLAALARAVGQLPSAVTPDAIAEVASHVHWRPISNWENSADIELATATGLLSACFGGDIMIATDHSIASSHSAMIIDSSTLPEFVENYLIRFGECFFNGDVVVVESEGQRVWMFHHEGAYSLLE